VEAFFETYRPEVVLLTAGLSGGILLNQNHPATLMQDNLATVTTLLDVSQRYGVRRLLYFGSSCMYPRVAEQPMRVESLGTGALEPTSAPYALARWAGATLCEAYNREFGCRFEVVIPANSFGPEDDFSPESGHVIPALIHRFHEAKTTGAASISLWGSGKAIRDFIYAEDVADACIHLLKQVFMPPRINIGSGVGVSIADLSQAVAQVVGYTGQIQWDTSRPDGQPQKVLDCQPLSNLGWQAKTPLNVALAKTYNAYLTKTTSPGEPGNDGTLVSGALPNPPRGGGNSTGLPIGLHQKSGPSLHRTRGRQRRRV
jgi:GDP-L-fucose synthase